MQRRRDVVESDDTWRIEINCAFPDPTAARYCSWFSKSCKCKFVEWSKRKLCIIQDYTALGLRLKTASSCYWLTTLAPTVRPPNIRSIRRKPLLHPIDFHPSTASTSSMVTPMDIFRLPTGFTNWTPGQSFHKTIEIVRKGKSNNAEFLCSVSRIRPNWQMTQNLITILPELVLVT